MSNINEQYIGSGIIFPFEINSEGRVPVHTGTKLIEASITQILSWPRGLKFFNERFGARLDELLEEPSDLITVTLLRTFITDAITTYESRVKLVSVNISSVNEEGTKYNCEVVYKIRNSQVIGSFVYPFYTEVIF